MAKTQAMSPMMTQYCQIKEENRDCIVFYRLGDFYEMFFEDAELASRELDLTLTARDCGQDKRPHVRRAVPQQRSVYQPSDRKGV